VTRVVRTAYVLVCLTLWGGVALRAAKVQQPASSPAQTAAGASAPDRALIDRYCVTCHNGRLKVAGLELDKMDLGAVGPSAETWEKVVLKIRAGQMPPVGRPRPDNAAAAAFTTSLEDALDRAAEAAPNPGRPTVHRLNRTEYTNAIRDLLAL